MEARESGVNGGGRGSVSNIYRVEAGVPDQCYGIRERGGDVRKRREVGVKKIVLSITEWTNVKMKSCRNRCREETCLEEGGSSTKRNE